MWRGKLQADFSRIGPCGENPSVYEPPCLVREHWSCSSKESHKHFVCCGASKWNRVIKKMFFSTNFSVYGHEDLSAHTDTQCRLFVIDKEHGCGYNTVNWHIQWTLCISNYSSLAKIINWKNSIMVAFIRIPYSLLLNSKCSILKHKSHNSLKPLCFIPLWQTTKASSTGTFAFNKTQTFVVWNNIMAGINYPLYVGF